MSRYSFCFVGEYNTTFVTNNPTCFGANDGSIYFSSSGCSCNSSNCQFIWSVNDSIILEGDGSSSLQTHKWLNNVGAGIYTATIIHPNGCQIQQEFILSDPIYSDTITACESYEWNDSIYTQSGTYIHNYVSQNNNSMSFDGDDYIQFSPTFLPYGNSEVTISAWVYKNSSTNSIEYILGYGGTGQALGDVFGMGLYGNQGIFVTFSGDQYDIISNYSLPLNGWQHLTAVHKLDGLVEIYLNANLIYSQQVDVPNINLVNGYIGVAPWGTNSFWNGRIDDVMIWNRALNQQEIEEYFNCPPQTNEFGLLSYWSFEEGGGSISYDLIGNNNGAINGAIYNTNVPEQSCQLTTNNGCDSIAILNLIINESTISNDTVVACDSYTWIDGVSYTESGNYSYEGINASGCSETNFLSLIINESIISNDTVVACDSYTWIDGISYTESGDYSYVGTNAAGCSEINTLTLTINESTISNDTVISCDSMNGLMELYIMKAETIHLKV